MTLQLVIWYTINTKFWVTAIGHCPSHPNLSVYLLSSHVTRSRPSPSIFAYCKQSKTAVGNKARPSLFFGHDLDVSFSPPDPTQWTENQVYCWVVWAVQEFNLTHVNLSALRGISGHQLCSFTSQQFEQLGFYPQEASYLKWYLNLIKAGKQVSHKAAKI